MWMGPWAYKAQTNTWLHRLCTGIGMGSWIILTIHFLSTHQADLDWYNNNTDEINKKNITADHYKFSCA